MPAQTAREYCPCCHRPKPKPRIEKLTPQLCEALRKIHSKAGLEFCKIPAYVFKAQHSRLKHWSFLEEQSYIRKDGSQQRRPGVWRVTERGEEFLSGLLSVPTECHLVRDQPVAWSDQRATWHEITHKDAPDYEDYRTDYERHMFGNASAEDGM